MFKSPTRMACLEKQFNSKNMTFRTLRQLECVDKKRVNCAQKSDGIGEANRVHRAIMVCCKLAMSNGH